MDEIEASHQLLFSRSSASLKLARHFYGVPLDTYIDEFWSEGLLAIYSKPFTDIKSKPVAEALKSFPILAPRLVHLLERMENWKPETFHELFIQAYTDRTNWWVAMFRIFVGLMSVLGLALNAYQIFLGQRVLYLGQRQIDIALKAFALQFNT